MEHDLGNGCVAIKDGKTYAIYKNGVFQFSTARLKFAKDWAKTA